MRTMGVQATDLAAAGAEQHQVFAENPELLRHVGELVGQAHGLPVAAQDFSHGRASFDMRQFDPRRGHRSPIGTLHRFLHSNS
jgi:hypothetical protein